MRPWSSGMPAKLFSFTKRKNFDEKRKMLFAYLFIFIPSNTFNNAAMV